MRRDGAITKAEERKVSDALEIIEGWLELHMGDERPPRNYWDVYKAHRELCDDWRVMCAE